MNPIPDSISHRQLASLLQGAIADAAAATPATDADVTRRRDGELEALLRAYGQLSQQVLQALAESGDEVARHRNSRQVMAMGALRAHVHMALQALAASQP